MHRRSAVLTASCLFVLAAALQPACGSDANDDRSDAGDDGVADAATLTADASPAGDAGAAGDGASEPSVDPALTGPYGVHLQDGVALPLGTRSTTGTVCSPSSDGGASPAAGPQPWLVVSPGFQLPRGQYRSMCDHLASWGYVVILQDLATGGIIGGVSHQVLAEDVGKIIDWALSAQSGLASRLDASALAVAGHSLGGKVSILAAILDARVKLVVGWDPVDANPPISNGSPSVTPELMAGLTVPLALLGETLDGAGGFQPCAPAADNYQQYYAAASQSPEVLEVTVLDADHFDWLDDRGACGFTCSICKTGTALDADTRRLTRRVTTAFLEVHLRARDELRPYLELPNVGAGVTVRGKSL